MGYTFNGIEGSVVCDNCSAVFVAKIEYEKYKEEYGHDSGDFCEECQHGKCFKKRRDYTRKKKKFDLMGRKII